jgi:hypothetical protein
MSILQKAILTNFNTGMREDKSNDSSNVSSDISDDNYDFNEMDDFSVKLKINNKNNNN